MSKVAPIGIDGYSILQYLLSYGILLAVLGYFMYPKLIKVIDERRSAIKNNLENAEKLQLELEKQVASHIKEKKDLLEDFRVEREKALKEIAEKRKTMLKEVEEQTEKLRTESQNKIDQQQRGLILGAEDKLVMIMKSILKDVLVDVPEETIEKSVVNAWKKQKNEL